MTFTVPSRGSTVTTCCSWGNHFLNVEDIHLTKFLTKLVARGLLGCTGAQSTYSKGSTRCYGSETTGSAAAGKQQSFKIMSSQRVWLLSGIHRQVTWVLPSS